MNLPFTASTLANGLELFVHEDRALPLVSVNLWYRVGSGDEAAGLTGLAHLFEHLMFMGSEHVPTGAFDRLLQGAGCDNNGSTTVDRTNYYEDGPRNALELMLWLEADRMGFLLPTIDADHLELQRGVVKNERRQSYENQPYGLAHETIVRNLYPAGHPYSWPTIGWMRDLDAPTLETIRDFFTRYYAPNNATLAVAGDVRTDEVQALVERYFGEIPSGPRVERPTAPPFRLERDVALVLPDRVQVPRRYHAWHSVRAFTPDDATLDAVANVLAGGKSSRLHQRLVYQLEIASQVTAYHDGGRLDGKFVLFATARPGHDVDELGRAIDDEVRRLADEGPSDREIERFHNGIEAQFIDVLERVGGFSGRANQLNFYAYMAGDPGSLARDVERYRAVTRADVQRAAQQYLAGAHRVVLNAIPDSRAAATPEAAA